jgi:hypothetical protein
VARRHRPDAPQPAQPLGRLDGAALGLVDELVEGGDLIQAQRARELRNRLDRRPAGAPEGDHERRRQYDDTCVVRTAGGGDRRQALPAFR